MELLNDFIEGIAVLVEKELDMVHAVVARRFPSFARTVIVMVWK